MPVPVPAARIGAAGTLQSISRGAQTQACVREADAVRADRRKFPWQSGADGRAVQGSILSNGRRMSVTCQLSPSRVSTNTTGSPSALFTVAVKREGDSKR